MIGTGAAKIDQVLVPVGEENIVQRDRRFEVTPSVRGICWSKGIIVVVANDTPDGRDLPKLRKGLSNYVRPTVHENNIRLPLLSKPHESVVESAQGGPNQESILCPV